MPKEITDPDWLRSLNAPASTPGAIPDPGPAQRVPREVMDPDVRDAPVMSGPTVSGAPDPVRKYAPGFGVGLMQSVARGGNMLFSLADAANQALPRPAPHAGFVSPELRRKGEELAARPYTLPGQEAGDIVGTVAPMFAGGVGAIRAAPGIFKEAAYLGGWEGAWMLAEHLTGAGGMMHGWGIPAWATARLLFHGGRKFLRGLGFTTKQEVEKLLEDAGVKAAGKTIAKEAPAGSAAAMAKTATMRAKTQQKFTPKEADKPTPTETKASSQKTAKNILKNLGQSGEPSSTDVAAAKLAKMTGAIHPGEEEVVEEFARMPVKR